MSESGPPPPGAIAAATAGKDGSAVKKAFPHVDLAGHDLPPSPAPSSPRAGRRYALATELVYTEGNDQFNASSVPIYQVSIITTISSYLSHDGYSPVNICVNCAYSAALLTCSTIHRVLHSNRHRAAGAVNTTTHDRGTLLEHILNVTWLRLCRHSEHSSYRPAWRRWM